MEVPLTEEREMKQEKLSGRRKGGLRTMPFILGDYDILMVYLFSFYLCCSYFFFFASNG